MLDNQTTTEECPKCKSNNCHQYTDVFICFNCGYKEGETKPLKQYKKDIEDIEAWKLSGNKNNIKRYWPGSKQ